MKEWNPVSSPAVYKILKEVVWVLSRIQVAYVKLMKQK